MPARGEVWFADLRPTRGSEQSGTRPVLILQRNSINSFTTTVLAAPLTTNLRRASLSSCVRLPAGEASLPSESVVLCHQVRALDNTRLLHRVGSVSAATLTAVEDCLKFTFEIP